MPTELELAYAIARNRACLLKSHPGADSFFYAKIVIASKKNGH